MASDWRLTFTLVDTLALKTTMNFQFHSDQALLLDGFTDANDAMNALQTDLEAVSDANVYNSTLSLLKGGTAELPADADVSDVAMVVCYLTGTGVLPKYHTLRIPAPVAGIFNADGKTIDIADTALIDYVANFLAGEVEVSDGEHIVDDIDNGIARGWWASVKKSSRGR